MASPAAAEQMIMYHVTNVPDIEARPKWTEIKTNIADDTFYDGDLVGLPVASFTTTLYHNGMPTISPYPRKTVDDAIQYWRVAVNFNPADYQIFIIEEKKNKGVTQSQLLCLEQTEFDVLEPTAREVLEKIRYDQNKANHAQYFPNGHANEYTNSDIFVNVHFPKPVSIPSDAGWDKVIRSGATHGKLYSPTWKEQLQLAKRSELESDKRELQERIRQLENENEQQLKRIKQLEERDKPLSEEIKKIQITDQNDSNKSDE